MEYNFMHFERLMPFKMHKTIFFSRKKLCVPILPKIFRPVTRNILNFSFGLIKAVVKIPPISLHVGFFLHNLFVVCWYFFSHKICFQKRHSGIR